RSPTGAHVTRDVAFEVCAAPPAPPAPREDWPQLGGDAAHTGARAHEVAPPLAVQWATPLGGHVIAASPVIAAGNVYVAITDLADGKGGGVAALDLATGAVRWRTATELPLRAGLAVAGDTVIAPQLDGTVLGLDAATGAVR